MQHEETMKQHGNMVTTQCKREKQDVKVLHQYYKDLKKDANGQKEQEKVKTASKNYSGSEIVVMPHPTPFSYLLFLKYWQKGEA